MRNEDDVLASYYSGGLKGVYSQLSHLPDFRLSRNKNKTPHEFYYLQSKSRMTTCDALGILGLFLMISKQVYGGVIQ